MQYKVLIRDASQEQWLSFTDPYKIYCVDSLDQVLPTLAQIEQDVSQNHLWAAGWISYEASSAFDDALKTHPQTSFPLLWFGVFRNCTPINLDAEVTCDHVGLFQQAVWSLNSNLIDYSKRIDIVKDQIRAGNTYQVNYTIRQYADLEITPSDAFLGFASNAPYGAFLDVGRFALCSASPELFFEKYGNTIRSRPMKGTAPRGRFLEEDNLLKEELYQSSKNRAENLMIVDMIRNDLGRIAKSASVQVPQLFDIEKYPTVWQMTSTVCAETTAPLVELFKSLFPCASITGAPKANTMKIINQLEPSARNIYTGAIGFIQPNMDMQFNVAIRTALIDKKYNQAEYGVGGGIVWDSSAESEFEECLIKSKVLSGKGTYTHDLLETLLWTPDDGYFLLNYHLNRLKESAEYFDYSIDLDVVKQCLQENTKDLCGDHKVRLLINQQGQQTIETSKLQLNQSSKVPLIKLAEQPVNKNDVFLFHKTTQRRIYQYFMNLYVDYDDVLLINQDGEITESCIANVVIEKAGKQFTPPRHCGLLNGTYRQYLLDQNTIEEKTLRKDDLETADYVFLINSVRKRWPVKIEM